MAYADHQRTSADIVARCAIVTVSDTRTVATDTSGQRLQELLTQDRHVVARIEIVPDASEQLATLYEALLADPEIDALLFNGGTGVSRRDRTIEVIESRIDIPLPGFGELFRMLSWGQIGSGALLSRAVAGVARGKPVFALPGSTKAVELGMTRLILPELRHLLHELKK